MIGVNSLLFNMILKNMKISKSTTRSIIYLVLFLIMLIILPMAFFVFCVF
jgi:hypothetical protein